MRTLRTITLLAFRETVRDRVLWGYSAFALLLLLGLMAVAHVPWGETHYIEAQLGYSAIALVSQVLVAVVAPLQLGRDTERRVHYMILGRDIRRGTYLSGKFLGLWFTTTLLGMLLVALLFALVMITATYRAPMFSLFGAVPAIATQSAMVLAAAILIYEATTSTTLAMLMSLLTVAIGRSIASVQLIMDGLGDIPRMIGSAGAYVFPNLELLEFNQAVVYETVPAATDLAAAGAYALAFVVAALGLAIFVFNRKEL